jgi:hypothetical protein
MQLPSLRVEQPAYGAARRANNWKSTMMLGKKSQDVTIKLKLEGDKLTGTICGQRDIPISHGAFKDDKISFSVIRGQKGEKLTQKMHRHH